MSWSLAPKRTLMNDANRNRFKIVDPPFENNPHSPGPAAYTPKNPQAHVTGSVALKQTITGKSERDMILSDGTVVAKILPIGPGSYETAPPGRPDSPTKKEPLATLSPRKPLFSVEMELAKSVPGPGQYPIPRPAPPGVALSLSPREACNPIVPNIVRLPSPRKACDFAAEYKQSPKGDALRLPSPRGGNVSPRSTALSKAPRHLNLANVNSPLPREHDADYSNPAPGAYDVAKSPSKHSPTNVTFSRSPRALDVSPRSGGPGPGSYDLPPIGKRKLE